MAKPVKVEKEIFDAVVQKLINAKPVSNATLPKSSKKLARIIEPIMRNPCDSRYLLLVGRTYFPKPMALSAPLRIRVAFA